MAVRIAKVSFDGTTFVTHEAHHNFYYYESYQHSWITFKNVDWQNKNHAAKLVHKPKKDKTTNNDIIINDSTKEIRIPKEK